MRIHRPLTKKTLRKTTSSSSSVTPTPYRSYDVLHEKVIILNGKLNRQNAQISQIRREMEATNILVVALCILTCVVTLAFAVIGVSTI